MSRSAIAERAATLHTARLERHPFRQPETVQLTLADAYAVQQAGIALREAAGETRVGIKLGFTSRAKMLQMGVAEMIIGQLTEAMQVEDGGSFRVTSAIHPRVEPEVAFLLGRALSPEEPLLAALRSVEAIAGAMEIIDSRYQDFRFSLADVVADNTSACGFVLGPWQAASLNLDNIGLSLSIGGAVRQVGSTSAILGNPWRAVAAAHALARHHGIAIPAGTVLLGGAATAAEALPAKGWVEAEFAVLGRVGFHVG